MPASTDRLSVRQRVGLPSSSVLFSSFSIRVFGKQRMRSMKKETRGGVPHRRELKGSESPKWVMRSWLAHHLEARLQVSQASDRPECKDEACCDDRYTKSVVSVASTLESALRYRCLGSVGKRDRNWLLPASIHSTDRRDHLATRTPWKPLGSRASPLWPAEYSGWHPSWPDARRHSPLPTRPSPVRAG